MSALPLAVAEPLPNGKELDPKVFQTWQARAALAGIELRRSESEGVSRLFITYRADSREIGTIEELDEVLHSVYEEPSC
jgi:hypothetical protein